MTDHKNSPYALEAIGAILEIRDYGNIEPLCALIEREPAVLHNKELRDLVLKILRNGGLQRGNGKRTETARIEGCRDEWIVRRMYFWKGFGLKLYGGSNDSKNGAFAFVVVADELTHVAHEYGWKAVSGDRIIKIWKKKKTQDPLYASYVQAETNGMMFRKMAIDDRDFRNKITKQFDLKIDWTKLKRLSLPAWLDRCGSTRNLSTKA